MIWWRNALGNMVARPWTLILGLGIGGFPYYSYGYDGSPDTNSTFLWFFYDMGLFGIVMFSLFVVIFIGTLRRYLTGARNAESHYLLLAATTAFVLAPGVQGLIEFDWTGGGSHLVWFSLSFVMAAAGVVKAEISESSERMSSSRVHE